MIGVPSSAGARRTGQERAPKAFRAAGLLERLRAKGLEVADWGDLPESAYRPDAEHPREQNLREVCRVARQVAVHVGRAPLDRALLLVLGGDCTITLGVLAGLLERRPGLGLVYFDGDVDLNTPATTSSGILDGMVMAHVLGRGAAELASVGRRMPMLPEEKIAMFGYNVESGWIDPAEQDALGRSSMLKYPLARVREDAAGAAAEALGLLTRRCDGIVAHFDVDVMEFAAADVPHPGGLAPDSAFAALRAFVGDARCAAIVVTEFNAERDPDGSLARELVVRLADTLGARREARG
ncbi:MAG: arginase family protein [Acidobacteria bacterium]|nr:arginase family protein [Acidobacteriota bacterium]